MGQRTKNRILEHSRPGHKLNKSKTNHEGVIVARKREGVEKEFWICKCGWEGWLTKKLDDPE